MNNKRSTTIPTTMSVPYGIDNNATTISAFAALNKHKSTNDIYSQLTTSVTDSSKYEPVEGSSCNECGSILDVGEVECTGIHGVCTTCYFEVLGKE